MIFSAHIWEIKHFLVIKLSCTRKEKSVSLRQESNIVLLRFGQANYTCTLLATVAIWGPSAEVKRRLLIPILRRFPLRHNFFNFKLILKLYFKIYKEWNNVIFKIIQRWRSRSPSFDLVLCSNRLRWLRHKCVNKEGNVCFQ